MGIARYRCDVILKRKVDDSRDISMLERWDFKLECKDF
jgi:hypothetical protein